MGGMFGICGRKGGNQKEKIMEMQKTATQLMRRRKPFDTVIFMS